MAGQQNDWWSSDPVVSAPVGGGATARGPIYGAPPKPEKPEQPKTTYRPMTPQEAAAHGLPPGGSYQISSEGKIDSVATPAKANPGEGFEIGGDGVARPIPGGKADTAAVQSRMSQALLKAAGVDIARGVDPVADLIKGSTSGSWQKFGAETYGALTGDATSGMENIAKLKTIASDLTLQLMGGSLGTGVSNADRDFIVERIGDIANANTPADARLAAWEQVKSRMATMAGQQDAGHTSAPALSTTPTGPGQNGAPTPGAGDNTNGSGLAPSGAKATTQDNPALAGVRAEYKRRLAAGQSAGDIIAWAQSAGIDPSTYPSIRAQVEDFKRTHRPISDYNTEQLDDMAVPLSSADQAFNAAGQSPLGAAAIAAADTASFGTLDTIVGATGGNAERARLGMNQVAANNPVSSTLGSIGGGVTTALGLEAGLGLRGVTGMARTLGADTLYGAGYGAGSADYNSSGEPASMADRVTGGLKGAALGLGGSYLGSKIGGGLASAAKGVVSPTVRAMEDVGAVTTIGQKYGQSGRVGAAIKGVEDRLAGFPVVGDVINAHGAESYTKFNSGAFDQALSSLSHVPELKAIGASVDGKVGADAVQEAEVKVQQAYAKALDGKQVTADATFGNKLENALITAAQTKRAGPELVQNIADILEPYMTPGKTTFTGEEMQVISQELRKLKAGYKNDTSKKRIGNAIDATEDAVFDMFRRQTPEVLPAYNAAKTAYRRVSILADAVNKAKNQTDNLFTPAQLGQADVANTIKYEGPIAAAKGGSQFRDYQQAAQEVLPNKVPDSGTAGRWLLPALAGIGAGGGAGVGYVAGDPAGGAAKGITLAAILSGAYSKAAQRALIRAGSGVKNPAAARLMQSETTKRLIQAGSATTGAALSNR